MRIFLLSAALLLTLGCSRTTGEASHAQYALADVPLGPVVAVVNGESITEPMLTVYARSRGLDPAQAEPRQLALDSLIENVLLAQDAITSGLMQRPEVMAEASLVRVQQIAGRALSSKRAEIEVSEEQILALYQQERERAGDTEWRVQHLLFGTRSEAEAALAQALAPGADFDALLGEFPGAKQAKLLEWSNASQLPESIVVALKQLQDGEIAPVVVESNFGFHVLRRAESRPFDAPTLESVREGARQQILQNMMKDYVAALRTGAEIATGATVSTP